MKRIIETILFAIIFVSTTASVILYGYWVIHRTIRPELSYLFAAIAALALCGLLASEYIRKGD